MKESNSNSTYMLWKKRLQFICRISIKTVFFNLKYLPFHQARHLPILISKKVNFVKKGGKVLLEASPKFGIVRIGFGEVGIIDYKYTRTQWDVSGKVVFKGKALIGYGGSIAVGENGELIFGTNFILTARSSIVAFNKVTFGDDCLLSWDVLIMDTDFHSIRTSIGKVLNVPKEIQIGNHVWVGCRSLILKGVTIPDNCIIGANSHLHKSLEKENGIYVGNPIKLVSEDITWDYD
jgi:acetyltransferase-like isoleucine patch superfamily enzyme